MAQGIIQGTTSNPDIRCEIRWTATADEATNSSTVRASVYYIKTGSVKTYGTGVWSISINGEKTSANKYVQLYNDLEVLVVETTTTVQHEANGRKSIEIKAEGKISGTTLSATDCTGTAALDLIPKLSAVTAANMTIGNYCNVKWTPIDKAYSYKLRFSLGEWEHITPLVVPGSTDETKFMEYAVPLEVVAQIPNAKSGTMTAELLQYTNTLGTQYLGSTETTFTVSVPDIPQLYPTIDSVELEPVTRLGGWSIDAYVRGFTQIKADITASAKLGASIVSRTITVEGKSYGVASQFKTDIINSAGTLTVLISAEDSRGFVTARTMTVDVLTYTAPMLLPIEGETDIICERCNPDGSANPDGVAVRIKVYRDFAPLKVGSLQNNLCEIDYRYKAEGEDYGEWRVALSQNVLSTNTLDRVLDGVTVDPAKRYIFQLRAVDLANISDVVTLRLRSKRVYMHRRPNSLGIFCFNYDDGTVDIDGAVRIRGGLLIGDEGVSLEDYIRQITTT